VPPNRRAASTDRGMLVLEQKLSILSQGPSRTRRNPALDVLTGRVPDERLQTLQASLLTTRVASASPSATPTAMVLPVAAIRMAAVARSTRPAPSPWLQATENEKPRLRLVTPPPSRWSRVPWIGGWLVRVLAGRQWCTPTGRSPRPRLAS
jgi:hypothetical protein